MERSSQTYPFFDRLLSRWGGAYLLRMQVITQVISYIVAAIGIYYIIVAANLNTLQTIQLFVSVFVFVSLVNLLLPIYTSLATVNARARLDSIIKKKPAQLSRSGGAIEAQAWQEVTVLPLRFAIVQAITAYVLVVLPVVLFMRWFGGIVVIQAVHIAIGGLLSSTVVVVQNVLFLERVLGPVRRVLLPADIKHQTLRIGLRLQTRLLVIIAVLIISALMMVGPIGYQKLLNASLPLTNIAAEILQFQGQAITLGVMILILGLFLGSLMTQSVAIPIQEIIKTLARVQNGDLSARATIFASDETSQLTFQLNQLLDQLNVSQTNLERQVEERTTDLNRRTAQLKAAAHVSRDASSARDLNTLLSRTVNLVTEHFGYYHTGIYLLDALGEYAVLHAASSEGGEKMIARGYRLEVGQRGVVSVAAFENRPQSMLHVDQDAASRENPDLPMTRSQLAIPLSPRGKVIGILDIQSTDTSAFSTGDIELLQTLSDQVALAIQNTQLIEESRSALDQLTSVLSENVKRSWSESGGENKRAYLYTPTGVAAALITDSGKSNQNDANQLHIPIALRGQGIGNMTLHRKGENAWSDADRSLAMEVANQIGLALENSRLLQAAQQRAFYEQTLSNLTARLGRSVDADTLLQTTVRELRQLPGVTEVSVFLTPPESTTSGENL